MSVLVFDPGGIPGDDADRQNRAIERESAYFGKKRKAGRPMGAKNKPKPVPIGLPPVGGPTPEVVPCSDCAGNGGSVSDEPVSGNKGDTVPVILAPVIDEIIVEPSNGPGLLTNEPPIVSMTASWRMF